MAPACLLNQPFSEAIFKFWKIFFAVFQRSKQSGTLALRIVGSATSRLLVGYSRHTHCGGFGLAGPGLALGTVIPAPPHTPPEIRATMLMFDFRLTISGGVRGGSVGEKPALKLPKNPYFSLTPENQNAYKVLV